MRSVILACVTALLTTNLCDANGVPDNWIDQISANKHKTWEGTYTYSSLLTLRMEGQANLYVIIYKLDSPNSDANLIDWFIVGNDKKIAYLRRADEKVMGMTPALQGTDVIPGKDEAEIIVRWTNPWMGGGRTVQKFSYCSKGLVLLAEAEYLGRPEMKWRRVVEDVGEAAPLAHDK